MMEETSFGVWLRQYRRGLDLTQKDLAQVVGCSEITIRKIEADEYRPSKQLASRLAESLSVAPSEQALFVDFARSTGGTRMSASLPMPTMPWQESHTGTRCSHPTNVQLPPTPTLGRAGAIAQAVALVSQGNMRLLTLVGAPGIGKTRLGIEIALQLLGAYVDGVFMVELAVIHDVERVGVAIGQALGIESVRSQEAFAELVQALRDKRMLLLLDNFEQVIGVAPRLGELLAACPGVRMVVTSREALHLGVEHVFSVPPLDLPDLAHLPPIDELECFPAVALFAERSRAVKTNFNVTAENAGAVVAICVRLDGIPLAIELAAARSRLLSPQALLTRLSSRLSTVVGGERDSLARHETLRNAISWSYRLLDGPDQALFRRLGVFVGACSLSAVEAVCNAHTDLEKDVLDGLESLLDKHLLQIRQDEDGEDETRLTMLETIREYALEQLAVEGEETSIRNLHAQYYLAIAEAADLNLTGTEQKLWLDRLEGDHDNLRSALRYLLERREVESVARMGLALRRFWEVHGHFNEGLAWLKEILEYRASLSTPLRAKVLNGAGIFSLGLGNHQEAVSLIGDSVVLLREIGDDPGLVGALNNLGLVAISTGNFERALVLLDEALVIGRRLGDNARIATLIGNLAVALHQTGDLVRAEQLLDESLTLRREMGHKRGIALALGNLAEVSRARGDYRKTRVLLGESLALHNELNDKVGVAKTIEGFAAILLAESQHLVATRLLSAVDAMLTAIGSPLTLIDQAQYESFVASSRDCLDTNTFNEAWADGQVMSLDQAIDYALDYA